MCFFHTQRRMSFFELSLREVVKPGPREARGAGVLGSRVDINACALWKRVHQGTRIAVRSSSPERAEGEAGACSRTGRLSSRRLCRQSRPPFAALASAMAQSPHKSPGERDGCELEAAAAPPGARRLVTSLDVLPSDGGGRCAHRPDRAVLAGSPDAYRVYRVALVAGGIAGASVCAQQRARMRLRMCLRDHEVHSHQVCECACAHMHGVRVGIGCVD